jgi:hypothetical protein
MTQQQVLQQIADRIGVDVRDAELGLRLARTGRSDLVNEVIAGRMTLRAALGRAQTKPAPATPAKCR